MARPHRLRHNFAMVAATGLALGFVAVTPSLAATGSSPYTIDGTVPDTWADPEDNAQLFEDFNDKESEPGPINANTTKLGVVHSAPKPMLGYTNPNAQVDLMNIWLDSDTSPAAGDDDLWLYLGWERDSNKGSGVIMYEFQQDPEPEDCTYGVLYEDPVDQTKIDALIAECNPFENRQPGDFVLVWDQAGNAAKIILRTWMFTDTDGDTVWDVVKDAGGDIVWAQTEPLWLDAGEELTDENGDPVGSNTDAYAKYSADRRRGEAAVNLTNTIFADRPGQCTTIGNVIPGTVTGNSDTADYKDVVLRDFADTVKISNCGSVKITKQLVDRDGNDLTGSGTFTTKLRRAGDSPMTYATPTKPAVTFLDDELEVPTDSGKGHFDNVTHDNLIAGTDYLLTEVSASLGWELYSITCKDANGVYQTIPATGFEVTVGVTTECLVQNQPAQGTLVIKKIVKNDDGGTLDTSDFSWSLNGVTAVDFLAGAAPADQPQWKTVQTAGELLLHGTSVSVTEPEQDTKGYATNYSPECTTGTILAGQTLTCTITNDDIAPTLTLVKTVTKDDGGTAIPSDFDVYIGTDKKAWDTAYKLTAGQAYSVSETQLTGYDTSAGWTGDCTADATDNTKGTTVTLALGQDYVCRITNDDIAPTLTLVKTVTTDNGGTAIPSDFDVYIGTDKKAWGTKYELTAGQTYSVSETQLTGYDTSAGWTGDCTADATDKTKGTTVSLALGQDYVCRITNDDKKATPAGTTIQRWVLHDSLTVSGRRPGAPDATSATVSFRLYSDSGCQTLVGAENDVPIGTASSAQTSTGVPVTDPGTYWWDVSFSGDAYNDGFNTQCDESTTITAVDDRPVANVTP